MFLVQRMKDTPHFLGKEPTISENIEKNRIYNPDALIAVNVCSKRSPFSEIFLSLRYYRSYRFTIIAILHAICPLGCRTVVWILLTNRSRKVVAFFVANKL